ncbi:MAG: AsmA family protein, partial [Acidobacteria bacterium]|nr:AsmA family protein [Acidobacteriota bacterium]
MKLLRRILVITASVLAVLVVGLLLYLAFGDLSRHKPQIEKFVTSRTGRAFTIGEPFELEVFPPAVVAEDVRFANAEWGSEPAMVEIGRFAVEVDPWSLIRGPIHVRTLELENVEILLEKNAEAEGNWTLPMAAVAEPEPEPEPDLSDDHRPPAVIEDGHLANVRLVYREPEKEDRVVLLENMQISPGEAGLLVLDGKGRLNKYPMTVQGELGTLRSLRTGRDVRVAIDATAGNLQVGVHGAIGSLNPLDGADLTLTAKNPDLALMLENLGLPVVATGAMDVEARLSDVGDRTGLELEATLGDISARTTGSFRRAGLTESDLSFEVSVADMARLAEVFEVADVPAEELKVRGHVLASRAEATLDGIVTEFAGAEARLDGKVRLAGDRGSDLRFEATAPSLADLRPGLPPLPLEASGRYAGHKGGFEVSELEARLGESDLGGTVSLSREDKTRLEADLTSRLVDLGALSAAGEKEGEEPGAQATVAGRDTDADTAARTAQAAEKEKRKAEKADKKERTYVFGEEPLPLAKLEAMDVRLHLTIADLALKAAGMKDVDLLLTTEGGRLELITKAAGRVDGTVDCSVQLTPSGDAALLAVRLDARDLRSGFMAGGAKDDSEAAAEVAAAEPGTTASAPESGGGIDPADTPRLSLELDLRSSGTSPREMASRANGHVLFTQGSGQVKSG